MADDSFPSPSPALTTEGDLPASTGGESLSSLLAVSKGPAGTIAWNAWLPIRGRPRGGREPLMPWQPFGPSPCPELMALPAEDLLGAGEEGRALTPPSKPRAQRGRRAGSPALTSALGGPGARAVTREHLLKKQVGEATQRLGRARPQPALQGGAPGGDRSGQTAAPSRVPQRMTLAAVYLARGSPSRTRPSCPGANPPFSVVADSWKNLSFYVVYSQPLQASSLPHPPRTAFCSGLPALPQLPCGLAHQACPPCASVLSGKQVRPHTHSLSGPISLGRQDSFGASQMELTVKNLPGDAGDVRDGGLLPGSGRSPGGGNGNPLQYSGLGNPMDRGA